ncbi:MAG: SDR family NAD(P)-dependent oxidoreductase, partial [Thermoplasmatales archaeon]
EEITSVTSNRNINFELSELSSMNSVRELAKVLNSKNKRIDVLINNAGGVFGKRILTEEGFERTIALNYLSPFLLTNLVLPLLKSSDHTRIINIGSGAHTGGRTDFDFSYPWRYSSMKAYSTSKLMLTMFTYALARHLKGGRISSTLVQPGFVATNLGKNSGSSLLSTSFNLMKPFQITAKVAAKTPIYLASRGDFEEINGKCFSKMKTVKTSTISYDEKLQDDLWLKTVEALGLPSENSSPSA